ncbi:MAG: GTP-binding protein [Oscillospiraceae bacterium]|nr:GTP-binding protein [Oscillospiraceae bacterium]
MTKIDIFSGFLGAGKTTLIKKLLDEAFKGEKLVLIENEFGEIGIDGGFLKEAGIQISEMNSGCICCSLVGDFGVALKKVVEEYQPDRVLIEPSGVGKLSDVIRAVEQAGEALPMELGSAVTVVNAKRAKMYLKNFGEFFNDQVEHAGTVILSRTGDMEQEKLEQVTAMLREHNGEAAIITTPWEQLTGAQILEAMSGHSMAKALLEEAHHHHHHEHEHHHGHEEHHEHDHGHEHGHEHDYDHDHDHEHHHHEHDHDHHDHGEDCTCGCHDHDHHHHHHDADEVFQSWGRETPRRYTKEELEQALAALDGEEYGVILRAKGILPSAEGDGWYHFDFVPGEREVRQGGADYTGRLCVIGSELKENKLAELFHL